jgi:hypothetical protein
MAASYNPKLIDIAVTTAAEVGIVSIEALAFAICFFIMTTILMNTIWRNVMRAMLVSAAAFAICFILFMAWDVLKTSYQDDAAPVKAQEAQVSHRLS